MSSYTDYAQIFKAMSDQTRLKIVDLLSSGEMCACQLLENFKITQPTLSYHMKILCDSGLVTGRREGAWMHYRVNDAAIDTIADLLFKFKTNSDKVRAEGPCQAGNRCCVN